MSIYKYKYECKQDKGNVWQPLSVATKTPMHDYEMRWYSEEWALYKQINPDTVAIRCLNMDGTEVARVGSAATVNKGPL
jgi:hypothetical protein